MKISGIYLIFNRINKKKYIGQSTKKTKEKLSKALSGENNPFYGQKHSPEIMAKMQETRKKNKELKNVKIF